MLCFYNNKSYLTPEIAHWTATATVEYCVKNYVDEYVTTPADLKIAVINVVNDFEPWGSDYFNMDQAPLFKILQHSDLVFIADHELHICNWELFRKISSPNIYWILPGTLNDPQTPINFIQHFHHFSEMQGFYCDLRPGPLRSRLQKLVPPPQPKPYFFDALLGLRRPHRDYVYNSISTNNLNDKIIVSYQNEQRFQKYAINGLLTDPDVQLPDFRNAPEKPAGSYMQVLVDDQPVPFSRILPLDVYNQSAYSIVAETEFVNQHLFFTEKTLRPIISQRLFVVFSGCGFLQQLRKIGFETFETVIDESYDAEEDDYKRWHLAMEQVMKLCSQDQSSVLSKIQDILRHNFDCLMQTDWSNRHLTETSNIIDSVVNQRLNTQLAL